VQRQPDTDDEIWDSPEERPRVRAVQIEPGELPERRVVVIDEDADVRQAVRPKDAPDPEIGATLHDDAQKRRWRLFRKGGE
jgi:hypothetical protein